MLSGMKTTAYLLGLAAVIALLALNLTESIRIRKALCGEYRNMVEVVDTGDKDAIQQENSLRFSGYRYTGRFVAWGREQIVYQRPLRGYAASNPER